MTHFLSLSRQLVDADFIYVPNEQTSSPVNVKILTNLFFFFYTPKLKTKQQKKTPIYHSVHSSLLEILSCAALTKGATKYKQQEDFSSLADDVQSLFLINVTCIPSSLQLSDLRASNCLNNSYQNYYIIVKQSSKHSLQR